MNESYWWMHMLAPGVPHDPCYLGIHNYHPCLVFCLETEGCVNMKTSPYQYGDSHYKDKMVSWLSQKGIFKQGAVRYTSMLISLIALVSVE